MDTLFDLPAHPLLVHIPVVLIPLAAAGVIVMAIKPAWHQRYRWAVLAIGFAGMLGAVLAAGAGEQLEERLEDSGAPEVWESHAEAGETARTVAILFFVVLALYVLLPWALERARANRSDVGTETRTANAVPRWIAPALSVVAIAGAIGSVITIADAGHSGAKTVWSPLIDAEHDDDGDGDDDGD